MKILSIESSGLTAGAAYLEDDVLKAEYYMNTKLTHSRTLLPMIEEMQKTAGFALSELDAIAVSKGPGSFTGLRIGAATAKGLGLALEKPIAAVSSLFGMAFLISAPGTLICPVMDARRGEVYGAAYFCTLTGEGKLMYQTVIPDCAISMDEFLRKLQELSACGTELNRAISGYCFLGDGVPVHKTAILGMPLKNIWFAPAFTDRQRASSIALLGAEMVKNGELISPDDFVPAYLRRPLAEKEKEEGILEDAGIHSLKKVSRGDFQRTKHPEAGTAPAGSSLLH